jgi:thioredoxin reductase (NADPH)
MLATDDHGSLLPGVWGNPAPEILGKSGARLVTQMLGISGGIVKNKINKILDDAAEDGRYASAPSQFHRRLFLNSPPSSRLVLPGWPRRRAETAGGVEASTIETGNLMTEIRDTVILGSGCAGLTAAIYTARAGLKPLVLEGHEPGGQLSMTTLVENFPGWPEGIQGPALIENMKKQAERFGASFQLAHLNAVELNAHPIRLHTSAGEFAARTLIIASGASARWLGLPSEQALIGHGVSSCATCDGFFFRGKEIAVVGGGDSAMEEALFLTRFASKVTLLHRRENFRASKIMLERVMAHPNIELRTNTVVEEVLGVEEKEVKGLRLRDVKNGCVSELAISGLFLGIGHEPNTRMFAGQMDLDEEGYIKTTGNVLTTLNGVVVPGVFACGDVQDRRYRQAITAAGSGCMAALEAEKYLEEHGH